MHIYLSFLCFISGVLKNIFIVLLIQTKCGSYFKIALEVGRYTLIFKEMLNKSGRMIWPLR